MEEELWKRNPEEGGSGPVKEAFGVHLDASGGHLAANWLHLGGPEEASCACWDHVGDIW